MTTSLDAYRSDREQLLARVRELETEVEKRKIKPLDWLTRCPMCGTEKQAGTDVEENPFKTWKGWTYPKTCVGWLRRLLCGRQRPHLHQHCTACGARWVVDAEGWRFD